MSTLPPCPQCSSALSYDDGSQFVCPECGHEWTRETAPIAAEALRVVRDANGTELKDGTKVKSIRLAEGDHDIDCRIEGIGAMGLKSAFVKKA